MHNDQQSNTAKKKKIIKLNIQKAQTNEFKGGWFLWEVGHLSLLEEIHALPVENLGVFYFYFFVKFNLI
jgi:hypothetical protein